MSAVITEIGRSDVHLEVHTGTIDPPNLTSGADGVATTTQIDVSLGDGVIGMPPIDMEEVLHSCYVSATGTIEVAFYNGNASTKNLASSVWTFLVVRNVR